MILPDNTTMTLPSSPLGAMRAKRTRWWQRLLVAMLVVGLVGLPSAPVQAAEKAGNDPLAQPVQIIGGVAGGVSALAGFVPVIATALGPMGIAALAAVALAAAVYNLFSCLGSFGGRKCSAATIAMSALAVGLAGANFAYQMDATSWFGTGEFMWLGKPRVELLPDQIVAARVAGDTVRADALNREFQTLRPGVTVTGQPGNVVLTEPLGPPPLRPVQPTPQPTPAPPTPSTMDSVLKYAALGNLGLGAATTAMALTGGGGGSKGSSSADIRRAQEEQESLNRAAAAAQEAANKASAQAQLAENERMKAEIKAEQERMAGGATGTAAAAAETALNQKAFRGGCEDGARARVGNTARPNVVLANTAATKVQYDAGFDAGMAGQVCQ